MKIKREIQDTIEKRFFKEKAVIIFGARQTGKTTLVKMLSEKFKDDNLYLNCDEPDIREILADITSIKLKALINNKKFLIIDEAQRVKNIGLTVKLAVDEIKNIQVIVTGSSTLDLANEINEPLTGRKYTFKIYPFSIRELVNYSDLLTEQRMLDERVVYGCYPDVVLRSTQKKELLIELTNSYLFKDILSLQEIRKPEILEKLLKVLASQIGSEVSYNEISNTLNINKGTVQKYIELLEKSFVIFKLPPFSRNLRYEISKMHKIYFYDNGIRNAILNDFKPFELRNDKGALWENYLISERLKLNDFLKKNVKTYFWRTQQQQEVDFIEESGSMLEAFEFKVNKNSKKKISKTFTKNYPESEVSFIDRENYLEFLNVI